MDKAEATQALAILRSVVMQARDDTALHNWGRIWIAHGLANAAGFIATNLLLDGGHRSAPLYLALWSGVTATNLVAVLLLRSGRPGAGTRTFVDTQVRILWLGFLVSVAMVATLDWLMGLGPTVLAPMIAVLAAVRCAAMGGLMGKHWYLGSVAFAASAFVMVAVPRWHFAILGGVWGAAQVLGGLWLEREKSRRVAAGAAARLV